MRKYLGQRFLLGKKEQSVVISPVPCWPDQCAREEEKKKKNREERKEK
jgi:hypothetical protein